MFKKRAVNKNVQKVEVSLDHEDGIQNRINQAENLMEIEQQQQHNQDEDLGVEKKVKMQMFKKPKALLDMDLETTTEEIENHGNYQDGETSSKEQKSKKKRRLLANQDADLFAVMAKQPEEQTKTSYDIDQLRAEMGKANEAMINFVENIKYAKENGQILDEDIHIEDEEEIDNHGKDIEKDQTQNGGRNQEEEEIMEEKPAPAYYQSDMSKIDQIKQQRQASKNHISQDDYIELCRDGDSNISNNMDLKRMAMFGETKEDFSRQKFKDINGLETKNSNIMDDDDDDEFNEMEDAFVQNALRQTNLSDRDFTGIKGNKQMLTQLKEKKAEQLTLANLEKTSLQATINLLEQAHLKNLQTKQADAEKIETIEKVLVKSKSDIDKWQKEKEEMEEAHSQAEECIVYWVEVNDMLSEKEKEIKAAQREKRQHSLGGEVIDMDEQEKEDEQYEMFQSNIRRLAQTESEKLKRKHKRENQQHLGDIDGDSSDDDADLPVQDRQLEDIAEFTDQKLALAVAAQEIYEEIDDHFVSLDNYLKYARAYVALMNSNNGNNNTTATSYTVEEIVFQCLKGQVAIQLFAYDPLGRYGTQLKNDIKTLPAIIELLEYSSKQDTLVGQLETAGSEQENIQQTQIQKVLQRIIEEVVFAKLEEEIIMCYNPYSSKQTKQLVVSTLQLIDMAYKQSKWKSAATLTIIQKILTKIVLRIEEVLRFTSAAPAVSNNQADYSKESVGFLQFCAGRNLRLAGNILQLRQILPMSNIVSLVFDRALNSLNAQVESLPKELSQAKALLRAKVLMIFPKDFILLSETISSKISQLHNQFLISAGIVNHQIDNLRQEEIEKLEQIEETLHQQQQQ